MAALLIYLFYCAVNYSVLFCSAFYALSPHVRSEPRELHLGDRPSVRRINVPGTVHNDSERHELLPIYD